MTFIMLSSYNLAILTKLGPGYQVRKGIKKQGVQLGDGDIAAGLLFSCCHSSFSETVTGGPGRSVCFTSDCPVSLGQRGPQTPVGLQLWISALS